MRFLSGVIGGLEDINVNSTLMLRYKNIRAETKTKNRAIPGPNYVDKTLLPHGFKIVVFSVCRIRMILQVYPEQFKKSGGIN